ncbi:hypothetical protein TNCV_5120101 [Trichonephila clavipes]|nr:hypothetical protein TNCV_5120101 [Trichonephila clavipes]
MSKVKDDPQKMWKRRIIDMELNFHTTPIQKNVGLSRRFGPKIQVSSSWILSHHGKFCQRLWLCPQIAYLWPDGFGSLCEPIQLSNWVTVEHLVTKPCCSGIIIVLPKQRWFRRFKITNSYALLKLLSSEIGR